MKHLLMIVALFVASAAQAAPAGRKPKVVWKPVSTENCGKPELTIRCRISSCITLTIRCDTYFLGLRDDGSVVGWQFLTAAQDRLAEAVAVKLDCSALTSKDWVTDGVCESVGPGGKIAALDRP